MASVSSLYSQFMRSQQLCDSSTSLLQSKRIIKECRIPSSVVLCSSNKNSSITTNSSCICIEKEEDEEESSKGAKRRREALFQLVFAAISMPSIASIASAETNVVEDFLVYADDANKFKISVPRGWSVGSSETPGVRSVTAFYPEGTSNSNVSVLITGLGPDFTRLESFGKVDEFAETLVSGLDRSWQRPPGVAAKLIDSKAKNGLYYIEYTLQNPGESCRHILSALGMASNGYYNRLYTVTGQYLDEETEKYKSSIKQVELSTLLGFRTIGK